MYQGEFVEKVLAGALSEPDIQAYIKNQTKKDLPGLLTFIHDKQGAIIAEGMFKDKNDYFNLQWRDDFNKLYAVAELVKARIDGDNKPKALPKVLDTPIFKALLLKAEKAGLVINNHWDSPTKLAKFVVLVNKTPGAMNAPVYRDGGLLKVKPFEDYFGASYLKQYISGAKGLRVWSIEDLTKDLFNDI